MEPQLKERLIGAAVLVALGVWLIPWILDGPAPETAEAPNTVAIELPAAEDAPATRTQTIDLEARRATPPQVGATETPRSVVADTSSQPARPDSETADASEAEAQSPPPAVAEVEPAAPAPEERTAAPAEGPTRGDWAVQLGSFGERDNAERLAKRVATFGSEPEVSTTRSAGRVMYRVRVGPHESRELAEAAASSLSAHGFVAQVVTVD